MPGPPEYVSQQELAGSGAGPVAIPDIKLSAGAAAAGLAGEAASLYAQVKHANDETASLTGMASYYQGLDALKQQYRDDPDPATAVQRFQADAEKLKGDVIGQAGQLGGETAARMNLHMTTKAIVDSNEVFAGARAKQKDGADASLLAIGRQAQTDAVTAPTRTAREEALRRYHEAVDGAANSGLISQTQAEEKRLTFQNNLDHADTMALIKRDPKFAISALRDPKVFTTLTPVQRETYIETAQNAIDKNGAEAAVAAGATFPAAASMIAGRIVHPGDTKTLFDRIILPLESGGRNLPPNRAGAYGPAQLLDSDVRQWGPAAGYDPRGKSDAQIRADVLANPDLNLRIGLEQWNDYARKYEGNVPLMMAAYNAGAGNADRWKRTAEQKFGPNFTAEQLASVVDFKETRDYLTKGHALAGARLDAFGVSPAGRYDMGIRLGHELTQQEAQRNHIVDQMASIRMADDPVIGMLKQGVDVDPGRLADTRAALVDAAATGSIENIKRLRDFDFASEIQPKIAQAFKMPFAVLDAAVNAETDRINATGANPAWQDVQSLDLLRKTRDAIAKARDDDPPGLLARAGIAKPVAFDPAGDPGGPDFRGALTARGAQAISAQKLYGGSAIALSPTEVDSLRERYLQAGANERFNILKAMADTLPPQSYTGTAKKITGNQDAGEFTARLLQSRPELAREMLAGEELMKTKGIDREIKPSRQALADTVGAQIFPDAREQGFAVDAAIKIDLARRAATGNPYDDSATNGVAKAFEDVAGSVVKRNGARTVAPPGMRPAAFTHILDSLDEHDLAAHGGAYDGSGKPFDAAWLGAHAQLRPLAVGGSRYLVTLPTPDGFGAPVMTGAELPTPLVVDMGQLAQRFADKAKTERQRALTTPREQRELIRSDLASRFPE